MKTIEPVKVWYNGQEVNATILNAMCMNDNLQSSATFQYQLIQNAVTPNTEYSYLQPIANGLLTMTGEDYDAWDTNEYAYNWVASQLNLIITGEYNPPTPEPPTEA